MARVKNPTTQRAAQTTESIVSKTVGKCEIYPHLSAFVDGRIVSSLKKSHLLSSVERCLDSVVLKDLNSLNEQIEIDREITTDLNLVALASNSTMANTKQTARKANNGQGTPAHFPSKGKPGGKAAQHMRVAAKDGNSNDGSSSGASSDHEQEDDQVQKTIKVGKRRRVWGGKARIYKRLTGVVHKYRPGIGALKEIRHYQKEDGVICSKAAVARLVLELCEKKDLRWQAKAIMALHEAFEDYFVGLFEDCVLEAIHGKRVTVMPKDMFIALRIRGEIDRYKGLISMRDVPRKGSGKDTGKTQEY